MQIDRDNPESVTNLLLKWRQGDQKALDRLLVRLYDEMRRLARLKMRSERPGHTLQPTAVVHEAYMRLIDLELDWQDRAHFLCMAARVMRRVLVDHARAHKAAKRGAGALRITFEDALAATEPTLDVLVVDQALEELRQHEERAARMIELHYFGGLSYKEMAKVLDVSEATVGREMRFARAWLADALGNGSDYLS